MKNTYTAMSGIGFLAKTYTGKFLFIAFLGIHLPLIALIIAITGNWFYLGGWNVILLTLVVTLVATAATLLLLNKLLWPLYQSRKALVNYTGEGILPQLPTGFKDEAGSLMLEIQHTIEKQDLLLKERKDLIMLFSHDMRTPLNSLSGLSELIQLEKDPQKLNHHAKVIKTICKQQLGLLENVLYLLRLEDANTIRLQETAAIASIIEQAVQQQRFAAAGKNITLDIAPLPHAMLKCNATLLVQSFSNLLGNAIKFSHQDATVCVKCSCADNYLEICFSDQGIGFIPEKAEQLFSFFSNAGQEGTAGEKSTGLGLYLTRKIIQKHNGRITAYSAGIGKGSLFTVTLPLLETGQV